MLRLISFSCLMVIMICIIKTNVMLNQLQFAKHIPGITLLTKLLRRDDVALVPWLVGEEWKKIKNIKSKYMFGHFELPSFYMNAMVQMPDHGELKAEHFEIKNMCLVDISTNVRNKEKYITLVMHFRTTMQMHGTTIVA